MNHNDYHDEDINLIRSNNDSNKHVIFRRSIRKGAKVIRDDKQSEKEIRRFLDQEMYELHREDAALECYVKFKEYCEENFLPINISFVKFSELFFHY